MIITDQFVLINMPRTSTSFARKVIKQIYAPKKPIDKLLAPFKKKPYQELIFPKALMHNKDYQKMKDQHGLYIQIPEKHKTKDILSILRSPFSKILSAYKYQFWQRRPITDLAVLKKRYPNFPDLSLEQYLDMVYCFETKKHLGPDTKIQEKIGTQTLMYIKFYAKNPKAVFEKIEKESVDSIDIEKDFPKITFIHTENLNQELHDYLITKDYPSEDIKFILDAPKVNVSKNNYSNTMTPEIIDQILEKEKLIFKIYPEYLPQ